MPHPPDSAMTFAEVVVALAYCAHFMSSESMRDPETFDEALAAVRPWLSNLPPKARSVLASGGATATEPCEFCGGRGRVGHGAGPDMIGYCETHCTACNGTGRSKLAAALRAWGIGTATEVTLETAMAVADKEKQRGDNLAAKLSAAEARAEKAEARAKQLEAENAGLRERCEKAERETADLGTALSKYKQWSVAFALTRFDPAHVIAAGWLPREAALETVRFGYHSEGRSECESCAKKLDNSVQSWLSTRADAGARETT